MDDRAFPVSPATVMAVLNTPHPRRAAALAALRSFGQRIRQAASAAAREAFTLRRLRPSGGQWQDWPEAYQASSSGLPEDEDEPLPLYRRWAEDAECPPPAYAPRPEGPPPSYEDSVRQDILGGSPPACAPAPPNSPASRSPRPPRRRLRRPPKLARAARPDPRGA